MAVHVVCVWHLMKSEIIKDRCQPTYVVDEYLPQFRVPILTITRFSSVFCLFLFSNSADSFFAAILVLIEDLHLVGYVTWTFHNRCNLRTSFCCKILLRIIFFPPEILHWKSISSFSPSLSLHNSISEALIVNHYS